LTAREEIANSITHGVGFVACLVGVPILIVHTAIGGDARGIVAASVYGLSLLCLYAASVLYHGTRRPRLKRFFEVLDHAAIYLLIAGTYTPIALVALRGEWGWTLFGLAWGIALAGIVYKAFFLGRFPLLSTLMYVLMGWLGLIAVRPLVSSLPLAAIVWFLAGGLAYMGGTYFYHSRRIPFGHTVWHVFVLAGSLCHFLAIALYVLPGARAGS
jgi:hemolysin III